MNTRRSTDVTGDVAKARARYEATRTMLYALLIAVVLGFLGLLLITGQDLREQNKQIAALVEADKQESARIKELLRRQDTNDANRQRLIDEAVAAIAAEQYRALVAHDRRTEEALNRALGLLDREVNSPANKEQPRLIIPAPTRTTSPAPFVGPRATPTAAPQPAPQPAPAPSPCEQRGKSGKCRK